MDTSLRTADTRRLDPRKALRLVAIAACLPYLALKTAWIAGSHIGIPEGSELFEHRGTMAAVNTVTVLMDAAVIVLAFALTRPWGRGIPAALIGLPLWIATGLLAPIVLGFPLNALAQLFGGSKPTTEDGEPFLHEWVFTLVYTGFGIQALALGALFWLYARERWGFLLGGRLGELPSSPTAPAQRLLAWVAAGIALIVGGLHLSWALGSEAGLNSYLIAHRASSFYLTSALDTLFALSAAAGVLLLAYRSRPAVRLRTALALGWTGGAALAAWGGWMLLTSLIGDGPLEEVKQPSQALNLAYAGQMIVGLLVLAVGSHFLAERAAAGSDARRS